MENKKNNIASLLSDIEDLSNEISQLAKQEDWEKVESLITTREEKLKSLSEKSISALEADDVRKTLTIVKEQDGLLKDNLELRTKSTQSDILKTRKMGKAAKKYQL